ncbi:MAG: 3-isopropylmalate dehydrogenase [Candidatus Marinimicrobia bacterium]|nr:3-isopropylmalate dehydrogenase [Candidatus Neomarinimicrobiota bacterium]
MAQAFRITALPGDGIGAEVMEAALAVLEHVGASATVAFEVTTRPIGGAAIEAHGRPIDEATLEVCRAADAILLGAVGGPQWDSLPTERRPEQALLRLRKELGLFTNLRPAKVYAALVQASSLKEEVVADTDLVVVRELTGGIYFGQPRGYDDQRGWNTLVYTRNEVERITRVAMELALKRRGKVTSVHKANVLESSQFWRDVVHQVAEEYPGVTLDDMYVDNAAMQLVRQPGQFDVILTQNMFGDILSDVAAMITGSLGMLPSASLGDKHALYEPVHGSAPDIAGQGQANPLAMIASVAMMLTISLERPELGTRLEQAIEQTLADGYRTADIAASGAQVIGTDEMTRQVLESYDRINTATETHQEAIKED